MSGGKVQRQHEAIGAKEKLARGGTAEENSLEKYKTPSTKAEKVITKLNLG